jgi:UDP-N-acetylmuramoylalanine--D-glutamate ligase
MKLHNTKTLVVGLGATGMATALFLREQGAQVTVSEKKERADLPPEAQNLCSKGVTLETGRHRTETFVRAELIVVSPGVSLENEALKTAAAAGVEIISEIELAYRFITVPIIAVTGTNGKTTTVNLIADMFTSSNKRAFLGGNVGNPLIEYVLNRKDEDYIIAEISSFQLEGIRYFKPYISVLLNLSHDHLDRYTSYADYIAAKVKLFSNQTSKDYALLNADDPEIQRLASSISATQLSFSCEQEVSPGIYCKGDQAYFLQGTEKTTFALNSITLQGKHNRHNIMAAIAVGQLCGCTHKEIQQTIENFRGLPHRLEWVGEVDEVKFYNDSKATNVSSAVSALEALQPPIILIAGGKDKGGDYQPLTPLIEQKVKTLILIGEAKKKMYQAFQDRTSIVCAETLEDAFKKSLENAKAGDTVLLSPACSSFDMFASYGERGNFFKTLVKNLTKHLPSENTNGNTQSI